MSEDEVEDLLDLLALRDEHDELNEQELAEVAAAEDEFERGEYLTREEVLRKDSA